MFQAQELLGSMLKTQTIIVSKEKPNGESCNNRTDSKLK